MVFVANYFAPWLFAFAFIRLLMPHLRRRLTIQIQMWSAMIIKHPKLIQRILQLNFTADAQLAQYRLERAE
jgi:hypothetical protein